MHKGYKYLSFFFLSAAMTATAAVKAGAQEVVITHEGDHTRYYDRNHHDYHQEYREFHHESNHQQKAYWNWRHSHPDHD
jgi:hypothetical protein